MALETLVIIGQTAPYEQISVNFTSKVTSTVSIQ